MPDVVRHRSVSPYVLLTLAPFFWSCNVIVGRGLSPEVPPFAMTFYRWLFAAAMLAPFAWPLVRKDVPIVRRHWKSLLSLGVIGIGIHNALAYLGLRYTTAVNGVILNSFIPVMIVALSWALLRERLATLQMAGISISLAGVLTILSGGSLATLLMFRLNAGDLLFILSMAMWSIYTIALRFRPRGMHFLSFLFVIVCIGDVAMIPLYAIETALGYPMHWSVSTLATIAAVAFFSSVLSYIFWNRGVEQVGANVAGLFVHLMPVFGVMLAWLVLDERLGLYHVAGIALILFGIYVTSRFAPVAVPAGTE
jgi:drug/metabolite transporter (DMT)-like permease